MCVHAVASKVCTLGVRLCAMLVLLLSCEATKALFRRSACMCAGFINKCTRKLRVNYGVKMTLDRFSRKERRA